MGVRVPVAHESLQRGFEILQEFLDHRKAEELASASASARLVSGSRLGCRLAFCQVFGSLAGTRLFGAKQSRVAGLCL